MSYKCEPLVEVSDSQIVITTWSGNISLLQDLCSNIRIKKFNRGIMEYIEDVKNNPWGPKYWNITGILASQLNSNFLPAQNANSVEYSWNKFAAAAAQVTENYYRQLELNFYILINILYPYLPVTIEMDISDFTKAHLTDSNIPDISYIGKKVSEAIESNRNK